MRFAAAALAALIISAPCAHAQETESPAPEVQVLDPNPDHDYGYGTAAGVTEERLNVNQYDYLEDRDVPVEYVTNEETTVEGAASLAAIEKGDILDVVFLMKGGKKVAVSVKVQKPEKPDPAEVKALLDRKKEAQPDGQEQKAAY